MFEKIYKVMNSFELTLLTIIISCAVILCAPISSTDELCSVKLVPNQVIAKRFEESVITIRCEANLDSELSSQSYEFTNPVLDLSFGGAPRTGVFTIRGNASCLQPFRTKCWSDYRIAANSIGHLIQHSGDIVYSCQVADQLRSSTDNVSLARCGGAGYLAFSNTLKYGDSCSIGSTGQECDRNMECGAPEAETESENEQECFCSNGFVAIPVSNRETVCLEEVSLGLVCNYTKQCSAIDSNSVCEHNQNHVKVCQCNQQSYPYSEYQTDYTKKCRIKSIPTVSPSNEENSSENTENKNTSDDGKSEDLKEDNRDSDENGFKTNANRNDSTGNVGIVLFFVAILLSILIVVIIIRMRNKSDKMVITKKKKTTEQQTDDNDGEQTDPILTTDSAGMDEVDEGNAGTGSSSRTDIADSYSNDEQINNKLNTVNNNGSQKIQTNV